MPPLPPKIKFLNDTAKLNPLAAAMTRPRLRRPARRRGLRHRLARRRPLRARAASRAQLVGVRGAGEAFDGLYYVTSVTIDAQARRVHAVLHARPQRPALDRPDGARMSEPTTATQQRYYGKYRGTVVNNVDPMQIGRIQAIVPDVSGVDPDVVGDAVPAGRRASTPASSPCRRSAPGVWVEFEQGDPDYPIWVGGYWGTRGRGAGARAHGAAGGQRRHDPDHAQERDRRQRRARARPAGS